MMQYSRVHVGTLSVALVWVTLASPLFGAVERYKTEAAYLGRLSELGYDLVLEDFESSAWDGTRSPNASPPSGVTSQQLLWEPASKDLWGSAYSNRTHGLTTNHNWSITSPIGWGLFENHFGDIAGYPTTIRVSADVPIYAVGGWFNTNPDLQSVGFLFEDRTTANEPGYYLPGFGAMYPGDNPSVGHEFVGIVDPAGFTSVVLTGTLEVNEENVLEGGTIFGADDFTIGVPDGFISTDLPGDANGDGVVSDADYTIWADNYGSSGADVSMGDFNGDGEVTDADYTIWADNYGQTIGDVPEPASMAFLALGGLALVNPRGGRNCRVPLTR
jgi:dockerin type I repeat protein